MDLSGFKEKMTKNNIFMSILTLILLFAVVFTIKITSNYSLLINNFFFALAEYVLTFSLIVILLYYIKEPFYSFSLVLISLISTFFIVKDVNNFLAYFFLIFSVMLFLLKKQHCIDKFTSKVGIAKTLALPLALLAFFFMMNAQYFQGIYSEFIDNPQFNNMIKSQVDLALNTVLNSSLTQSQIDEQLKKAKEEIIKNYEKTKQEILSKNISEEEKQVMLEELEKNKEKALKKIEEEYKKQIVNLTSENQNDIIETIKKFLKENIKKENYVKLITISLIYSILSFLNMIAGFIYTLLILIIDFILSFFRKEKNELNTNL